MMAALEIDVPHHPDHLRVHEWKADFQSESAQTSGDVCPHRHLLCFCGDDLPGSGKTILNSPLYRREILECLKAVDRNLLNVHA